MLTSIWPQGINLHKILIKKLISSFVCCSNVIGFCGTFIQVVTALSFINCHYVRICSLSVCGICHCIENVCINISYLKMSLVRVCRVWVWGFTWNFLFNTPTLSHQQPGALCNMGYPSEMHLDLKPCEALFAHNLFCSCPIVLKFGTEHGNDTAMLCAKFQNDWTTEMDVMPCKCMLWKFFGGCSTSRTLAENTLVSLTYWGWHKMAAFLCNTDRFVAVLRYHI